MCYIKEKSTKIKNGIIRRLKKAVIIIRCFISNDKEKNGIARFLIHMRGLAMYPYEYTRKYEMESIDVFRDEDGYPFVMHSEKRLYLIKGWSKEKCQSYYNNLRIEQDIECTHKYLLDERRYPNEEDIVADIGTAEGIFGLDVIDLVKKLYLFEGDEDWIIPLNKTFSLWKHKVCIVNKYVSDSNGDNCVSLDGYFTDENVTYIKADIEGSEQEMLKGADRLLSDGIKKALICTYHKTDDEIEIKELMEKYGFDININSGYLLMTNVDNLLSGKYLRRGVLFAQKN